MSVRHVILLGAFALLCVDAIPASMAEPGSSLGSRVPRDRAAPGSHIGSDTAKPARLSAWHITKVQLRRGGFRPCSDIQSYSFADPYGRQNDSSYDNPTAGHRKCIIAEVTMTYDNPLASSTPQALFTGYTEAWGISIPGDFRSNRTPYAHTNVYYGGQAFQGQGGTGGISISNAFDAAVTYYDTALEHGDGETQGFSDRTEPESVREHLQTEGAEVRFSVPGVAGSDVFCHYREGRGPRSDTLSCPGLDRQRFNGENRFDNGQ